MARIGIIANPASGKDIRRLVSYATTIDNSEKVNICKRAVLAAEALGVRDVVFMPDTFTIGYSVQYQLEDDKVLNSNIEVLDFLMDGSVKDTEYAAGLMEDMGVGCVIREFVQEELSTGLLREIALPAPMPSRAIGFAHMKNTGLPNAVLQFVQYYKSRS